jgi:hypothetical protein
MTTVVTSNKGFLRFDLKEHVRETAWALARTNAPAAEKNRQFAKALGEFDPRTSVIVYPFADNLVGWATLVAHPTLGDIVAVDLPWIPTGTVV